MNFTLTLYRLCYELGLRNPLVVLRVQGEDDPDALRARTLALVEACGVAVDREALLHAPQPVRLLHQLKDKLGRLSTPESLPALVHASALGETFGIMGGLGVAGLERRLLYPLAQLAVDSLAESCSAAADDAGLAESARALRRLPRVTDEVTAMMAVAASPSEGLTGIETSAIRMLRASGGQAGAQRLLFELCGVASPEPAKALASASAAG